MINLPFTKRTLGFAILTAGIATTYGAVSLLTPTTFEDSLKGDNLPSEMIQDNILTECWGALSEVYGIDEKAKYTYMVMPHIGGVGAFVKKDVPQPVHQVPNLEEAQARLKAFLKGKITEDATPVVEEMNCIYVSGKFSKTGESTIRFSWGDGRHRVEDTVVIPKDDKFHTTLLD